MKAKGATIPKALRPSPYKDQDLPQMTSPRPSKKLPDPIFESIEERKEYGSYLSVIKGKDKAKTSTSEVFELGLTGKGIPQSHLQEDAMDMKGPFESTSNPPERSYKEVIDSGKD